jgi:hypothetical protein
MRYPMILPWLSRKAGVTVAAAERIWDEVLLQRAVAYPGEARGSAYWGAVLRQFRKKLSTRGTERLPAAYTGDWVLEPVLLTTYWVQIGLVQQALAIWAGTFRSAWAHWPRLLLARAARMT